ncbi:MAG: hypothetical protein ACHQ49_03020 [Elusimicrobiota bacterium]
MMTRAGVLPLVALAVSAGTSALAGASEPPKVSSAPASAQSPEFMYYSDLGPDEIDVSAYPGRQRLNYAVYVRACSRCHGLARSINAPYASRGWWEFYMTSMRMRGLVEGRPFSKEEVKSVLDFLEYDSLVRKIRRAPAFEKSTEELKRRFEAEVDRRMSDLQNKPQPLLLPSPP